jgi:hypothetical protein
VIGGLLMFLIQNSLCQSTTDEAKLQAMADTILQNKKSGNVS